MPPPTPSSDTHFETGNVRKTKTNWGTKTRDFIELATVAMTNEPSTSEPYGQHANAWVCFRQHCLFNIWRLVELTNTVIVHSTKITSNIETTVLSSLFDYRVFYSQWLQKVFHKRVFNLFWPIFMRLQKVSTMLVAKKVRSQLWVSPVLTAFELHEVCFRSSILVQTSYLNSFHF